MFPFFTHFCCSSLFVPPSLSLLAAMSAQQQQSGWKFSVTVPSWTTTTLESDEPVVVRDGKKERERALRTDGMRPFRFAAQLSLARTAASPEAFFLLAPRAQRHQ